MLIFFFFVYKIHAKLSEKQRRILVSGLRLLRSSRLYAEQHFLPSCSNYILVGERNKLRKKRNNVFYRIFRSFLIIFEPPPFSSSPLDWVCLCFFFFILPSKLRRRRKKEKSARKNQEWWYVISSQKLLTGPTKESAQTKVAFP